MQARKCVLESLLALRMIFDSVTSGDGSQRDTGVAYVVYPSP